MAIKKIKVVIWCGAAANQKALANKIAAEFEVNGIVIDTHSGRKKKKKLAQVPATLWDRFRFGKIYNAWGNLMKYYDKKFPGWPLAPQIKVPDINNEETEI